MTVILQTDDAAPGRVRFFPRQLVTADELNDEQAHHRARLREHNRLLHGWGVVCGCDVRPASTDEQPWLVRVCPGYALSPQGDPIRLREESLFDVAGCVLRSDDPCAYARPCLPVPREAGGEQKLYLAVRAVECHARAVQVASAGCSCDEAECEYSRIREGHEVCCLSALPDTHVSSPYDVEVLLAGPSIVPCPDCPEDPWVVIATLTLPAKPTAPLTTIDPLADRRILLSTAALQEMVLALKP